MSDTVGATIGRVKWFNGRKGFGFLTSVGTETPTDVFVHHSSVRVADEQYKYLVQGEYVSFVLKSSDSTDHPYQAGSVRGVLEGPLMCETRNENRSTREGDDDGQSRESHRGSHRGPRRGQNNRNVRPRGGGPRSYNKPNDGQSWVLEGSNNSVDNSEDA